jgi:hypothetical protein
MEISPLKNVDPLPWREAFPGIREEHLPGISLQGGADQGRNDTDRLSELTGIPQRHLSMMEHGKRPIGKKMRVCWERS